MSSEPWTIERIADTLPHSALRQEFLAQANRAPIGVGLQEVLDRWIAVAQECVDAAPRIETLMVYFAGHGELPAEYEATLIDLTDRIGEDANRNRGVA